MVPIRRGSLSNKSMTPLSASRSESCDTLAGEAEFWDETFEKPSCTGCDEELISKLRCSLESISGQLKSVETKHKRFVSDHHREIKNYVETIESLQCFIANQDSEIKAHLETIRNLESVHDDKIESITKSNSAKIQKLESDCEALRETEQEFLSSKLQYESMLDAKDAEIRITESRHEVMTLELKTKFEARERQMHADISEMQKEFELSMLRTKHEKEMKIHELEITCERQTQELKRGQTEFHDLYAELENTRSAFDTLEGYVKDIIFPCDAQALLNSHRPRVNSNLNPVFGLVSQLFTNIVLAVKKSLRKND